MRYEQAIISYSGFQQSEARRSSFEDGYFDYVAPFTNDETITYAPRTWKSDVKALANQLRRQGIERVALLSYSHGQAAVVEFARYAHAIGVTSDLWIGCDPVYRPTWLGRRTLAQILSFRAMLQHNEIKVPEEIIRTVYLTQDKDRPCGHKLIPSIEGQVIEHAGTLHTYGHTQIDGSPEWWALVREELNGWVNPPKAIPQ